MTQGLMGALRSFILIPAVADLSVTLATDAAGRCESEREVPYCSIMQGEARRAQS